MTGNAITGRGRAERSSAAFDATYLAWAVGLLGAEIAIVAATYLAPALFLLLVLVHVGLCVLAGLAAYRKYLRGQPYALAAVLVLTTLFLGPVAPAMLLLVLPYYLYARRHATPFEEWYRSLFPDEAASLSERLYEIITRGEAPNQRSSSVASFIDVMRYGDTRHKFAVISLMARNFRPAFSPILKAALRDDANEIRVQAATVMAKVTDENLRTIQGLQDAVSDAPDDLDRRVELARALDDFSYSGLLDPRHEHEMRARSLEHWMAISDARPDDEAARMTVGRLLMRLERLDLAAPWMERAIAENRASAQMLVWHMECLYRQDRLDELRAFAAKAFPAIEDQRDIASRARAAVKLWSASTGDRAAGEPAHA